MVLHSFIWFLLPYALGDQLDNRSFHWAHEATNQTRRIKRVESIFTKASTSLWFVKLLECLPNIYSSSGDHVQWVQFRPPPLTPDDASTLSSRSAHPLSSSCLICAHLFLYGQRILFRLETSWDDNSSLRLGTPQKLNSLVLVPGKRAVSSLSFTASEANHFKSGKKSAEMAT